MVVLLLVVVVVVRLTCLVLPVRDGHLWIHEGQTQKQQAGRAPALAVALMAELAEAARLGLHLQEK